MCKVIKAISRAEFKAFYDFSKACGYSDAESEYLKKYTSPVLNPIRASERAYLYVTEAGRVTGRLLTWKDRARDAATGQNRGFFALCDAICPAGTVLMDEMLKLQREWGSADVVGPVAPDGSGFFNGMALRDAGSILNSPYMQVNLPEACGFERMTSDHSFILKIPETRIYMKTAENAAKRFGLKLKKLERTLFSDELQACAADFAAAGSGMLAARQAERISGFADRNLSFEVLTKDGKRAGFILTLKGRVPRVTTLFTGQTVFTAAAACMLIDAVHGELLHKGVKTAEAGVVSSLNLPSMALTRACGCEPYNEYCVYIKQLTK